MSEGTQGVRSTARETRSVGDEIGLDAAMAVRELAPGRFAAVVRREWDGPLSPHGGMLVAKVLGAIDATINAEQAMQARTLSCHFLRPPAHGEVEIVVETQRVGRRFANTGATLSQDGKPCVLVQATHAVRGLPRVARWQPEPPPGVAGPPRREAEAIPPPDYFELPGECWLQPTDLMPRFLSRLKIAPRFGHLPYMLPPVRPDRHDGTVNGGWLLPRTPRSVDPRWLVICADAFWPSAMQALTVPVMSPTLDLTIHFRAELPPEGLPDQPLLVHNRTLALIDGASDTETRIFTAAGDLLAQARQLQFVAPLET